jgi:hypothetical protein
MTTASSPVQDAPAASPRPKFFIVGDPGASRVDPRVVAHAVIFNIDLREGEREFSATAAAHEIPLLRKKYGYLNGSLTVSKVWVPATPRAVALNQAQFLEEVKRLTETSQFKTETRTIDFMQELYGSVKRDQVVGVMRSMKASYIVWKDLEPHLLGRALANWPPNKPQPHPEELAEAAAKEMTDRELESIIRAADPSGGSGSEDGDLEGIILAASAQLDNAAIGDKAAEGAPQDETEKAIAAAADAGGADPTPRGKRGKRAPPVNVSTVDEDKGELLIRYFTGAGLAQETAEDLATLVESGEKVTDESIVAARGLLVDKLPLARKLLASAPRP